MRYPRITGRSLRKMKILNTMRHKTTLRVCVIPEYGLYTLSGGAVAPLNMSITFMELFEKTPNEAT